MTQEQSNDQQNLIRQSLLNTVFAKYNELVQLLKSLPVDPTTHGLLKSISFIDDGIVWAKEIILNAQLILGAENKENAATEVDQSVSE